MTNEFFPAFTHSPLRSGDRLMIQSVCTKCGAYQIVSMSDRSLEEWEDGHVCENGPRGGDQPGSMPQQ